MRSSNEWFFTQPFLCLLVLPDLVIYPDRMEDAEVQKCRLVRAREKLGHGRDVLYGVNVGDDEKDTIVRGFWCENCGLFAE